MDKLNFLAQNETLSLNRQTNTKQVEQENKTCFDDYNWCDNAANAIGEQFDNMDDFLDRFIKSQNLHS